MPIKILYAEDTQDLNRAVCAVLEHEGFDVTSTLDGAEAAERLASDTFDLAILDIMMPRKSGIEVLREMRAAGNVTPTILLTAKTEVDDRVEGLESGADDYLPKPFAMKELVARIHSLARRNTDYGVGNLSFGDIALDAETFELRVESSVRLSHLEFELLRALILNSGRTLTPDFLLGRVWSGDDEADADTVRLYVRYLSSKLDALSSRVTIRADEGGWRLVAGDVA